MTRNVRHIAFNENLCSGCSDCFRCPCRETTFAVSVIPLLIISTDISITVHSIMVLTLSFVSFSITAFLVPLVARWLFSMN